MGPGKVLSGLVKRIDKRVDGSAINDVAGLQDALSKVQ
jgi:[acyl-carrier-protein] S-malonyltransferase